MKTLTTFILSFFLMSTLLALPKENAILSPYTVLKTQVSSNANNVATWIWNTGVFDQNLNTNNSPGFEWPKNTGKFAIFSAGLSIGAYVNGELRLASASYSGENAPGYVLNGVFTTNAAFKLYKVSSGDNASNNPDYANWGLMVPYGAPYVDVDGNGTFNPLIDKPGVKNAAQTIFVCLTDADPTNHTSSEGFSGGTAPLLSEMRLTSWSYSNVSALSDVQFIKMQIINKNTSSWDSTIFGIVADPDLGDASDDYIGCDVSRNLGICYNSDNNDGSGTGTSYGLNPPAVGIDLLKGVKVGGTDAGMTAFDYFTNTGSGGIACEQDPSIPLQAYNILKGFKKDGTPWINAQTSQTTKFCFPGDPETASGWTEYTGVIQNCGGSTTGNVVPSPAGDRRFVMITGGTNLKMNSNDTQTVVIARMIARGSNNKNSVTLLKKLSDTVQTIYNNNFSVGINTISSVVPEKFELYQNYPNPFNPTTKIKFYVNKAGFTSLTVFDITGKEVAKLVNQNLNAGTFEYDFRGENLPSGVYFYKLETAGFTEVKKMTLIK